VFNNHYNRRTAAAGVLDSSAKRRPLANSADGWVTLNELEELCVSDCV